MSANEPAVSVVVPVRNEAGNIAPLIAEIAAALAGTAFEVVYVNDGSSDATDAELKRLMAQYPWLRRVRHKAILRTIGGGALGRCRRARLHHRHARRRRAERSALYSGAARARCKQGAPRVGLIAGQRVGRKASGFKKLQSRIANAVRGAVLRDGTRDTGCGLKAFYRDLFLRLPYFDGLHRFLPALVGARASPSAMSTSSTGRAAPAFPTTACGTGCGSAFLILPASGG